MGYFKINSRKDESDFKSKKNLVLIMDEVDGMSAGDRGGVGQMVALCKSTRVSCFTVVAINHC